MGCGLHARVPQLNPLPDAVHRTINGTSMERAVAMELRCSTFCGGGEGRRKKKSPPKLKTGSLAPTTSPGRRALCRQRYVDRTGGEELARCSNTYVANEITCDGTLDITISLLGAGCRITPAHFSAGHHVQPSKTPSLGTTRENEATACNLPLT